jgi:hypothetical protein
VAFYWRRRDVPELRDLSPGQRTEVLVATAGRRIRDPFLLLMIPPWLGLVALGNFLGGLWIPLPVGTSLGGGLGAGLAALLFCMVSFQRGRPHLAAEVRRRYPDTPPVTDPALDRTGETS